MPEISTIVMGTGLTCRNGEFTKRYVDAYVYDVYDVYVDANDHVD